MKHQRMITAAFMCCLLGAGNIQAQSVSDWFSKENLDKVVNAVTGKTNKVEMTGTWNYTGTACEFETENLLKKAGGALAASAVETQLDEQCAKIGMMPGKFSFTFNADSTFVNKYGKKQYKGTYSYNAATQKVHLKYAFLIGFHAKTEISAKDMNLLFNADALLKMLTFFGSKSSSTMIKTASELGKQYDGMLLGFELKKK
ncbi:MAG: DUF4923 family protein [Bacteroides sp.]